MSLILMTESVSAQYWVAPKMAERNTSNSIVSLSTSFSIERLIAFCRSLPQR